MQTIRKKKLINFRLPAALALSLILGIVFGTIIAYFEWVGIYILIPFVIAAAVFAVCTVAKKRLSLTVKLALITAFFLIGAFAVYVYFISYGNTEVALGETCQIVGRVERVGVASSGRTYLVLSGVTANGTALKGRVIAYLGADAGEYCGRGYIVTFTTTLSRDSFFVDGNVAYQAGNRIKYFCSVSEGMEASYRFSLFGKINEAIQSTLFSNLDGETAAVCYALLTGDASLVSESTLVSFRNGGIAHLFAVSGLHIGVIFGALTLLFKKLPVNRYVSAVVRIGVIIFYTGICYFSPSSVRAAVTCSVLAIASLAYKKYDAINALSIAAIILLIVNPLYVFGAGFILSFSAAFGIVLLSYRMGRGLRFLPEKPRGALAVALSAQISTIPAQFACFGYISWAGLFLNLIVVPAVSVLYILLFAGTLLSIVMPFQAGAIVSFCAIPIQFLINAIVDCGLENAIIAKSFGWLMYVPFALATVGVSDKFNVTEVCRGVLCGLAVIILTVICIV